MDENTTDGKPWPVAIDPTGCGCTECCTGEYIPLERASDEQLVDMLTGLIGNNIGAIFVNFMVHEGQWQLMSFDTGDRSLHVSDLDLDLAARMRRIQPDDIDC